MRIVDFVIEIQSHLLKSWVMCRRLITSRMSMQLRMGTPEILMVLGLYDVCDS
jgi:hypothetical protein